MHECASGVPLVALVRDSGVRNTGSAGPGVSVGLIALFHIDWLPFVRRYRVVEVEVTLYDGRRVRALTLEGQQASLHSARRPVAPSRRYLNLLRDGGSAVEGSRLARVAQPSAVRVAGGLRATELRWRAKRKGPG